MSTWSTHTDQIHTNRQTPAHKQPEDKQAARTPPPRLGNILG